MDELIKLLKELINDLEVSKVDNIYDKLNEIWGLLYSNQIFDPNYLLNYNNVANKKADTLTDNEVITLVTYILRQERFHDGFVDEYMYSKSNIQLLKNFLNILEGNIRKL